MLTAMGDVLREAHARGWITTRDGNISVRKGKYFYITPSAGRKTIVYPENIIKYEIKDERLIIPQKENTPKPSIELDMHWQVQKLSKRTKAVVHLHPTAIVSALYAGLDLYEIGNEFPELKRYTKVGTSVPFLEPGSVDLANAVAVAISPRGELKYNIVGMHRHGVTAVGDNPWEAFEHVERLNHICEIVLMSKGYK